MADELTATRLPGELTSLECDIWDQVVERSVDGRLSVEAARSLGGINAMKVFTSVGLLIKGEGFYEVTEQQPDVKRHEDARRPPAHKKTAEELAADAKDREDKKQAKVAEREEARLAKEERDTTARSLALQKQKDVLASVAELSEADRKTLDAMIRHTSFERGPVNCRLRGAELEQVEGVTRPEADVVLGKLGLSSLCGGQFISLPRYLRKCSTPQEQAPETAAEASRDCLVGAAPDPTACAETTPAVSEDEVLTKAKTLPSNLTLVLRRLAELAFWCKDSGLVTEADMKASEYPREVIDQLFDHLGLPKELPYRLPNCFRERSGK